MDALALLCTLHADGPATLKRLRSLGLGDLGTLVEEGPEALASGLGIEPAAARRLVREAKLLRHRVADEGLDVEEAPPRAVGGDAPASPIPSSEPEGQAARHTLDELDKSLIDRLSSQSPKAAASAERAAEPALEPALEARAEVAAEPALGPPAVEVSAPFSGGAAQTLAAGRIPGLDEDLVLDLGDLGVTTFAQLAAADSLGLTRLLGVTFAQARRLRFLARREAALAPADDVTAAGVSVPIVTPAEPIRVERVAVTPAPAPPQQAQEAEVPESDSPAPEPLAPEPLAAEPAPVERAAFWEPRPFLEPSPAVEEQGVRVDPSEIEARPRFGERFARAAAERREAAAQAATSGAAGKTILGWNFEIPRPAPEELPLIPSAAKKGEGTGVSRHERASDTAGPFA